jgi:hypothetical protein
MGIGTPQSLQAAIAVRTVTAKVRLMLDATIGKEKCKPTLLANDADA